MSATGQKLNRSRKPKRHAPSKNRRENKVATPNAGRFGKGNRAAAGHYWKKGQSGNKYGRPRTAEFSKEVRLFLRERDLTRKDGEARLLTLLERLLRDDPKQLLYYAYGKPMDTVQLQDADGGPLAIMFYRNPTDVTGPAPEKLLEAKKNET